MFGNSPIQIINSERAVGTIISKFSTDFIIDVIQDNIKMRFRPFNVGPANYPIVIENELKMAVQEHPAYKDNFDDLRLKTYKEIVTMICSFYGLKVSPDIEEYTPDQMFTLATILFDIFVTNFTPKMIGFFTQYIINNKDDIYNSIPDAEEIKKNKDTIAYGKKMYTDPKLIVIHASLNSVLTSIAAHDIPFRTLIFYLTDMNTANYLLSILQDTNDIYKYHYASFINDPCTRADLFTAIKFDLQSRATDKAISVSQYTSPQSGV
jgi:hypothetical protein